MKKLSEMLRDIRAVQGHSLRKVEKATGISNAYLSQLERGDADQPSPGKLNALASFYKVPYMELMDAAGYVQPSEKMQGANSTLRAALMHAKLTPEQEREVVKFVQFLQSQKK